MAIYSPGELVAGRYRITRPLSQGGMGAVYLAEQVSLGRSVAIKVILPHHGETALPRIRFENEARGVCQLRHPNIITYHDYGLDEAGRPFLVMEFLPGRPGTDLVYDHPPPTVRASLHVLGQLASALETAHAHGIIHRDLKWSNAMIAPQAHDPLFTKLIDFGILKVAPDGSSGDQREELTRTGVLLGTPQYMSPEAICGRALDARADQYSLAVMTYEILTGRRPFDAHQRIELLRQHVQDPPPPMDDIGPYRVRQPAIEAAVFRALNKNPHDRFASVLEFHDALVAAARGRDEDPDAPATRPRFGAIAARTPREAVAPSPTPSLLRPVAGAAAGSVPPGRPHAALARTRDGSAPWHVGPYVRWAAAALALMALGFTVTLALLNARPTPEEPAAPASHDAGVTSAPSSAPLRGGVLAPSAARSTPAETPTASPGHEGSSPPPGGEGAEAPRAASSASIAAPGTTQADHGTTARSEPSPEAPSSGEGVSHVASAVPGPTEPLESDAPEAVGTTAVSESALPAEPHAQAAPRADSGARAPSQSDTTETVSAASPSSSARRARDGLLTIVATPYAEVRIDGVVAGTTPIVDRKVKAGRRRVEFSHPTFGDQTRYVTVKADGRASLTVNMRP